MGGKKVDPKSLANLSEDEIAHTLEMSPESVAKILRTVAHDPRSTIEPLQLRPDAPGRQALAGLGEVRSEAIVRGLAFGATIGEGGMGIVRAATQRSLGRKVAVKTLRPEVKSEQATLRLLREAWVTGALEHPNIVPVYDLGLDEDGTPIIVLKHIEGLVWSEIINDAASVKARFGADDLLDHNLRILVQLCNAVSLAHARGILHRDLKPENVMVGRFGEVYLVDWGIAVSLREDPTGRMPLASQATELAGTPSYMAPEMLGGVGKLGERTDVYLLGAILYEILVGRPPHEGDSFREIVASILLSKFTFPEHVPAELAEIASRAMSRAAEERFASADELRQKLEWYLRHRGSLALSAEAALRVDEMRTVLERGGDPEEVRDRVNHLFAEARFGFRQAIRTCDDNEIALRGLREATEIVVEFELEEGMPEAAAAALAELESPPPELAKRVADAMRAREAEKRRLAALERLEAVLDPSTGRLTRLITAALLGVLWTISPQVVGWFHRHYDGPPHWLMYAATVLTLGVFSLLGLWGRESLSKTIVNRRMVATIMLMFAAQLTLQVAGHLLRLPDATLQVLHLFCWFMSIAAFAILIDFRFWPSMVIYLAAFLFAAARPSQCFNAMSVASLLMLVNLLVAWSRPREAARRVRERVERRRAAQRRH